MKLNDRWWGGMGSAQITDAVTSAVTAMHPPPEWLVEHEVGIEGSYVDIMVLGMWGHRWAPIIYEVKASRGDFAKELANPKKRLPAEKVASRTYFAVPVGLVKEDEVPQGWGLVEVVDGLRCRTVKHAMERAPVMTEQFVLRLLFRTYCRATGISEKVDQKDSESLWRKVWKHAGQDWTFEQLMELAKVISAGFRIRNHDIEEDHRSYEERRSADPHVKRMLLALHAIREVTGVWQIEGHMHGEPKECGETIKWYMVEAWERRFQDGQRRTDPAVIKKLADELVDRIRGAAQLIAAKEEPPTVDKTDESGK